MLEAAVGERVLAIRNISARDNTVVEGLDLRDGRIDNMNTSYRFSTTVLAGMLAAGVSSTDSRYTDPQGRFSIPVPPGWLAFFHWDEI